MGNKQTNASHAKIQNILKDDSYLPRVSNNAKTVDTKPITERIKVNKEMKDYVIFGYIRLMVESQYTLSALIPTCIKLLCSEFLGVGFYECIAFRTFAPNSDIITSDKFGVHTHSSYSNNKYSYHNIGVNKLFISQTGGWSSGIHQWKIKILTKTGETTIGVCNVHTFDDLEIDRNYCIFNGGVCRVLSPTYFWFCFYKCNVLDSRIYQSQYLATSGSYMGPQDMGYAETVKKRRIDRKGGVGYDENDEIIVCLDCDNWKIYWFINDDKLLNEIDIKPNCKYYPFISSNSKYDTFQVLLF